MSQQVSGSLTHTRTLLLQQNRHPAIAKGFPGFAASVHQTMLEAQLGVLPVFQVDPGLTIDLFEFYLMQFDPADRQYHNCDCCRAFINKYGSLATLDADGNAKSVLWNEAHLGSRARYRKVLSVLRQTVERGKVVKQFLWDGKEDWGQRATNGWDHLWAKPTHLSQPNIDRAEPAMAKQMQNRIHLAQALADFSLFELERAIGFVSTGGWNGQDRMLPWLEFLKEAKSISSARGESYNRRLWYRVAKAPAGWCTPRSSIVGALIDDMRAELSTEGLRHAHNKRMDPLKYQRPETVSAGNIARAEQIFQERGLAKSLERRPALLNEVQFDWQPKPGRALQASGIFGHLAAHERTSVERSLLNVYPTKVTYARFLRDALPRALDIEAIVPHQGNFIGLTTAVHEDAPPILQWDSLEKRNPFAWYVYHNGSPASNWGLKSGRVKVVGITKQPSQWNGGFEQHGSSFIFLLEGAADQRDASLALFPECLRSELHEVRSTIEAFSRTGRLQRMQRGLRLAAGLRVTDTNGIELLVRTAAGITRYMIDRLD